MTSKQNAKAICKNVNETVRSQAETLADAVIAMQNKIKKEIPNYKKQPLAQEVTTTSGETVLKQNPATAEFRATVRDYAAALRNLQELVETNKGGAEVSSLDSLKNKIKIAK